MRFAAHTTPSILDRESNVWTMRYQQWYEVAMELIILLVSLLIATICFVDSVRKESKTDDYNDFEEWCSESSSSMSCSGVSITIHR